MFAIPAVFSNKVKSEEPEIITDIPSEYVLYSRNLVFVADYWNKYGIKEVIGVSIIFKIASLVSPVITGKKLYQISSLDILYVK